MQTEIYICCAMVQLVGNSCVLFQVEEILLGASRELDSLCDPAFWEAGVDRPLVIRFHILGDRS